MLGDLHLNYPTEEYERRKSRKQLPTIEFPLSDHLSYMDNYFVAHRVSHLPLLHVAYFDQFPHPMSKEKTFASFESLSCGGPGPRVIS